MLVLLCACSGSLCLCGETGVDFLAPQSHRDTEQHREKAMREQHARIAYGIGEVHLFLFGFEVTCPRFHAQVPGCAFSDTRSWRHQFTCVPCRKVSLQR